MPSPEGADRLSTSSLPCVGAVQLYGAQPGQQDVHRAQVWLVEAGERPPQVAGMDLRSPLERLLPLLGRGSEGDATVGRARHPLDEPASIMRSISLVTPPLVSAICWASPVLPEGVMATIAWQPSWQPK